MKLSRMNSINIVCDMECEFLQHQVFVIVTMHPVRWVSSGLRSVEEADEVSKPMQAASIFAKPANRNPVWCSPNAWAGHRESMNKMQVFAWSNST